MCLQDLIDMLTELRVIEQNYWKDQSYRDSVQTV